MSEPREELVKTSWIVIGKGEVFRSSFEEFAREGVGEEGASVADQLFSYFEFLVRRADNEFDGGWCLLVLLSLIKTAQFFWWCRRQSIHACIQASRYNPLGGMIGLRCPAISEGENLKKTKRIRKLQSSLRRRRQASQTFQVCLRHSSIFVTSMCSAMYYIAQASVAM